MGCGSSVAQVSDTIKEGLFKPLRLLEVQREGDAVETEGRVFLFGQTRTQRKIIELQLMAGCSKAISSRVRIPVPRITYDPIELMYEESQEIFHLGVYGLSVQPPFNRMLALWLQSNIIMLSGGRDFDGYNIKNQAFFYSIAEQGKEGPAELTVRTDAKPKYSANKFQKIASMTSRRYGHMGIYIQKLKSVLVFGGINDKEEILKSCQRYGVLDNAWKEISSMNVPRAYGNCFQFSNKVYVFGGRSSATKKSKKIQVFDLETYQWQILPFKVHRGVEDALVASQNPNEIMIIGGKTATGPTKSVIKIDIANQTYSWDSNLNHQYQSVKGSCTHSKYIVFGGAKDKIEVYQKGQWTVKNFDHRKLAEQEEMEIFTFSNQSLHVSSQKPQSKEQFKVTKGDVILFGNDECPCLLAYLPKEGRVRKGSVSMKCKIRSKMAVIQYEEGKYFLAGGCDWKYKKSFSSCYFYNSENNQTQETVKMNEKKYNFAACYLEGFIYIFGGYDSLDKTSKKSCAKFSLANQGWDILPSMRRARSKCHALVISPHKIAVFGGISAGEPVLGIEIFHVSQRKFDIFEPTLQLPAEILCSYSIPNNDQFILILNKGQEENAPYQLTTICLGERPQNSSRSTITNNAQIVRIAHQAPQSQVSSSKMSSKMSAVEPIIINQPPLEEDNIIRVKPKLVEIKQKKLQSQSSQMNGSQDKQLMDDLDSNFHIEKIDLKKDLRKNKTEPVPLDLASDAGQKEQKKLIIDEMQIEHEVSLKINAHETKKEKVEQQTQQNQAQLKLEAPAKDVYFQLEEPKIQQPRVEEQFKVISSKPIDWLSKTDNYLVASRLDHIYFLTNASCIQLSKQTGNAVPIDFKNNTKVSIDMIK